MKLVIQKDQWTTGTHLNPTTECMCAVGHYLKACDLLDAVWNDGDLERVRADARTAWLVGDAITEDDDTYLDFSEEWVRVTTANDQQKFADVKQVFAKHGVEVEFVGF